MSDDTVQPTMPTSYESEAVGFLYDLVAISSVSGNEHGAACAFVQRAASLGYDSFVDHAGNAIAHRGASREHAKHHIVLLGHIDTVPGDIPVQFEDGPDGQYLTGRGTVDAKGPLVTMLYGAAGVQIPDDVCVSVVGAVREETDSAGAEYLASRWSPSVCIIGEPSGVHGITLGYKGILRAKIIASSSSAHSAGNQLSPCDSLFQYWMNVQSRISQFNAQEKGIFHQVQSTILSTSSSSDGCIDTASIEASFRLPPKMSSEELRKMLRMLNTGTLEIKASDGVEAHASPRNDLVVRAFSQAIRATGSIPTPKLKTGTADMNIVAPVWNCPIAAYGPGDSSLDHTPEEHVFTQDVEDAVSIVQSALTIIIDEIHGDSCV